MNIPDGIDEERAAIQISKNFCFAKNFALLLGCKAFEKFLYSNRR